MTSPSALVNDPFARFQAQPAAQAQSSSQSNSSSSSSSNSTDPLGDSNTFITLLTAQLQAQDPLDPMSPSEMVDQLTQINSLEQLIQIQGDLQTGLGLTATGTPQADVQGASQAPVSQTNSSPSNPLANA